MAEQFPLRLVDSFMLAPTVRHLAFERVDGQPLASVPDAAFRDAVGLVPQEPYLMSASVRDNIAMGRPGIGDDAVEAAAQAARAHDFITALPQGYDTRLGEGGARVSTGQKQRVSIARAILHEPPVLFFDEPTSGLDLPAARTVVRFIRRCRSEGRTVLFSTHIMSEAEALCDRIAVVYGGRIAATGTLAELRARTGETALENVFLRLVGEEP